MIRVFVSSVRRDFEAVRDRVVEHLRIARYDVVNMESFGARPRRSLDVCLSELRSADVVVLAIGPRYGSLAPDAGVSFTHAEYREARRAGIPVLAFVVDPQCPPEEVALLKDFADEVGGAATGVTYSKTSAENLPAQILAGLTAARDAGDVGTAYKLIQPWRTFFSMQLRTGAGAHALTTFFGRQAELDQLVEFGESGKPVLMLMAPGGAGKSRLLLEFAVRMEKRPGAPRVFFVDAGAEWEVEAINALPTEPTILVIDDAHRRPDLDQIIGAAHKRSPRICFLLSCRPGAVGIVEPKLAMMLPVGDAVPRVVLGQLSHGDAVGLARACLTPDFADRAESLVRAGDRNPLVITVGGRCIATKQLDPAVLDHTPEEFRQLVLDRLLDDPALNAQGAADRRRVLEVLAAIGPVNAADATLGEAIGAHLRILRSDVNRILAAVEAAGFIQRRGRIIRITPDVLADHILYRAAVDLNGNPTGFVDEILTDFAPKFLDNILANAAELDWRGEQTSQHGSVLASAWIEIENLFPTLTHWQRAELLGRLTRAAVFAPEQVLRVVELACSDMSAPPDPEVARYGLADSSEPVIDAASRLLGFIATDPAFAARCLEMLWRLAEIDDRETNPHPNHPRRQLSELLKYARHIPLEIQVAALNFAIRKLDAGEAVAPALWMVNLISLVLARNGEANSATSRAFTIGTFALYPFLGQIAERRLAAVECLTRLVESAHADVVARAIECLGEVLQRPFGVLAREVTAEELDAWLPEAKDVARRLASIASSNQSNFIRYLARRQLRERRNEHWPALAKFIDHQLGLLEAAPEEAFFDALAGIPWSEQEEDWEKEQEVSKERCGRAARAIHESQPDPAKVASYLITAANLLAGRVRVDQSQESNLILGLVEARPDAASDLARALLASDGEEGPRLCAIVLAAMKQTGRAEEARGVARDFATDPRPVVRAYLADSMRFLGVDDESFTNQLGLIEMFLKDPDLMVRRAAVLPLAQFRGSGAGRALELLVATEWGDDPQLAELVCGVLDKRFGIDPARLTEGQIDALLSRLSSLPSLDGRTHRIFEFINFTASRRPVQTIEILLTRIRRPRRMEDGGKRRAWTPIPYGGHDLKLGGLASTSAYLDCLRRVRDAATDPDPLVRFWIPKLFRAAVSDFESLKRVLRESLQSGGPEAIVGAAALLRGFEHTVVFDLSDLVVEILARAAALGDDCESRTRSELLAVAISGTYMSSPGRPAPRHVETIQEAQKLIDSLRDRSPALRFYESLRQHARESIQHELEAEEEEGDE